MDSIYNIIRDCITKDETLIEYLEAFLLDTNNDDSDYTISI